MDASLALYVSPFVGSVRDDLDNTIKLCFYLIDKHPVDIRQVLISFIYLFC